MMACRGSGGIAPRILDLGARWRWVVSFMPRPLYPQGKGPWYPLDRRLGGSQSRSGRGGEEKNSEPPPGIEPQNPDRPARYIYICIWNIYTSGGLCTLQILLHVCELSATLLHPFLANKLHLSAVLVFKSPRFNRCATCIQRCDDILYSVMFLTRNLP
jgi:hypothetical protein